MSDKVKDDFKPLNLSVLENFDGEQANRNKDSEPDWDKFKVFYEDLKSEQKEGDAYNDLFDTGKELRENEKPVFEQFGKEKTKENKTISKEIVDDENKELVSDPEYANDINLSGVEHGKEEIEPDSESVHETADDDESAKRINHQAGYDEGYEQGIENGKKDGYEKGFEQGEKDGQEKGSKEGYDTGYEQGENEAAKEVEVKITEKTEDFNKVLLKLENTYQELAVRYEEKIISLICSIAEKVVLAKVEIDEEVVKETVLDALKTLPEPEDIVLSVSDEDYEYIEMVKEDLFGSIKSLKSVSVKSDASVKRGGCRIETKQGYIETDIATKLEKIFLSIKGEL